MKYECFGEAKRLAIAAYEEGKQWHQLVIDTLKTFEIENCVKYITTGRIYGECRVIGVVCDANLTCRGWRKHKYSYYWVPNKRLKEGKRNAEIIDSIPAEPQKAMNAFLSYLGFEEGCIKVGSKVSIPGIKLRDDRVFLRWPEWHKLQHPEVKRSDH